MIGSAVESVVIIFFFSLQTRGFRRAVVPRVHFEPRRDGPKFGDPVRTRRPRDALFYRFRTGRGRLQGGNGR